MFKCSFCELSINGLAKVLDKTHIVHPQCEKPFLLERSDELEKEEVTNETDGKSKNILELKN